MARKYSKAAGAIGLSEARQAGKKVPKQASSKKKANAKKKSAKKRSASK